jgi:hypothetical protein
LDLTTPIARAGRLLLDGKGALEQRLGLGVTAPGTVELGEVVEGVGDVGALRPEVLLPDEKARLNSGSASA